MLGFEASLLFAILKTKIQLNILEEYILFSCRILDISAEVNR